MTLLLIAISGLAAGGLHVLAGPDHLAAVAPLAADTRRSVWRAGLLWGIGHTGGVLVVAALALLLREMLPLEAISGWSERIVGVALVAVGLWGLRRALGVRIHAHEHEHDGTAHVHVHAHAEARVASAHAHTHTSFAFGVLHGLAGSSHVLGIIPALALPTLTASVVYLAAYGTGNIAAMTAFSAAVGAVAARARSRGLDVYRGLLTACSIAAVAVGGVWLLA